MQGLVYAWLLAFAPSPVESADGAAAPSERSREPAPHDETDEDSARIQLQVRGAGSHGPVGYAQVFVMPPPAGAKRGPTPERYIDEHGDWQRSQTTDERGRADFELPGAHSRLRVIVLAAGYERFDAIVEAHATTKVFLVPDDPHRYRTTVRPELSRGDVSRHTLSPQEIAAMPGNNGDALRATQALPSVARAPFGLGLLLLRGSGPGDSRGFFADHEVIQLFHFGGVTAVINGDLLESVELVPGNPDESRGDVIGGVIEARPRAGRRDGFHGHTDVNMFHSGALVEGPLGRGSFAVAGRRSYVDLLLRAALPDDAGIDLTVAPRYWDYQFFVDHPVGKGQGALRLFGSDDRVALVDPQDNEAEGNDRDRFANTNVFHRADLEWRRRWRSLALRVVPSYRFDRFRLAGGDLFDLDGRAHVVGVRAEVRQTWRRRRLRVGTDPLLYRYRFDGRGPALPDSLGEIESNEQLATSRRGLYGTGGLYGRLEQDVGTSGTVALGLRASLFTLPTPRVSLDPRLSTRFALSDRTALRAAVGTFSQLPDPPEFDTVWGNPRVRLERATHTSAALEHDFGFATLQTTAFFHWLWDLATPSTELQLDTFEPGPPGVSPERFASTGAGRVYGLDFILRRGAEHRIYGWVAYTLSRSERRPNPTEDFTAFDFDQTHILHAVGIARLPRRWQIGLRYRVTSGNPDTPLWGAIRDDDFDAWQPRFGPRGSARLPSFHQMDLRIDKRWYLRRVALNAYLDIQNAYNARNVEFLENAFDGRSRRPIHTLPIVPSIGLRTEF